MELNGARLTQHWNLMRFTTKIFSQLKCEVNLYFKKDKFWNSSAFSNPAFSISQTETWPLWKHILTSLPKYWISVQTSFHMQWREIIQNILNLLQLVSISAPSFYLPKFLIMFAEKIHQCILSRFLSIQNLHQQAS